jgi:hypothetical protein
VIESVTEGLSGVRYQVRWDDGHSSVLAPGAGNLTIDPRGNGRARAAKVKARRPKLPAKKKAAARAKRKPKRRK